MSSIPYPQAMIKQLSTEKELHQIIRLINKEVKCSKLLPRPKHELWRDKENVFVYEYDGYIVGCCHLVVYGDRIAELRSLVVKESFRGNSIANDLIEYCKKSANKKGIIELFSITCVPDVFEKLGFNQELNGQKAVFLKL